MKSLSYSIKSAKDLAVCEILPGLLLSFATAAVSRSLVVYLSQLGGAAITISLGILLEDTFPKQPVLAIGTKFAENKLLEFSVFLPGATAAAQMTAQIGVKGIVFVLLQMSAIIISAYLIGKRLQFSDTSSLTMAGGNVVCGSSVIASIALSIHVKEEEKGQTITLANLLGTMMMLILPFLRLQLSRGSLIEKSALLGGTLQSVDQVVADASLLDSSVVEFVMLFKILRITMLVVVVYLFEKFMYKKQPVLFEISTDMQKKQELLLPWYILGFVILYLVNNLFPLPVVIDQSAHFINSRSEITALVAIGLHLDFAKFMKEGTRFLSCGLAVGLLQTVMVLLFI